MNKKKIFNDPVYGFISFPYEILYEIIDHPYFQRLRRISQLGLTYYVYPGALHTRFHHALGALHLMTMAIRTLRAKNIEISEEEAEAVSIGILLHDIGHGPFSHALEYLLVDKSHEYLSLLIMKDLNKQFDGRLSLAIKIFEDKYEKKFLHQLISGQLDMDRMDYLNRDSYFTGVAEGVIGYDRIIKMLDVRDDQLVVEEKGIYSIEKFLLARRIMYWQVYLHKTVLSAEQMLIAFVKRLKNMGLSESEAVPRHLRTFLNNQNSLTEEELVKSFCLLDDIDIINLLKIHYNSEDGILRKLAKDLLNRNLFKVLVSENEFEPEQIEEIEQRIEQTFQIESTVAKQLLLLVSESNQEYQKLDNEIFILFKKDNAVKPLSDLVDYMPRTDLNIKYFLCFPRLDN